MNERLKELAVQAKVEHCISHVRLQEYGELIIQKCVAISDDYVKDCTCEEHVNCKHPRSAIGKKIKEHFGVEG